MHSTSTPKFSTGYRQRDVNQVHPLVLESGKKNAGAMSKLKQTQDYHHRAMTKPGVICIALFDD